YGFDPPSEGPMPYDLVTVKRPLTLSTVAQLIGTSPGTIKELNPALHRGVVPPTGYAVRLPKGSKETFEIAYANLRVLPEVTRGHSVLARRGHKSKARHRAHHSRPRQASHKVAVGAAPRRGQL